MKIEIKGKFIHNAHYSARRSIQSKPLSKALPIRAETQLSRFIESFI